MEAWDPCPGQHRRASEGRQVDEQRSVPAAQPQSPLMELPVSLSYHSVAAMCYHPLASRENTRKPCSAHLQAQMLPLVRISEEQRFCGPWLVGAETVQSSQERQCPLSQQFSCRGQWGGMGV